MEIRTDKEVEVLAMLTTWALRDGVDLIGLTVERLTLEDVYLRLTGYEPDDAEPRGDRRHERRGHRRTGNFPRSWTTCVSWRRQICYEQLSFWLNPVAAVFTVGFSVVFLVLLGASGGQRPHPHTAATSARSSTTCPAFAAYGVMSACFNKLAITLVVRREMGLAQAHATVTASDVGDAGGDLRQRR